MSEIDHINSINAALDADEEDTQKDKYLTFRLGSEEYGIEIKYIIEIIGIQKITAVPNIKSYIKGIINLRGIINPVVDVRMRFNLAPREYDDRTCIIVVELNNISLGLIVDEVSEVINIPPDKISPPPQTNKGSQSHFLQGIAKVGEQVKIILNIDRLLYDEIINTESN